jgi:hypothetical protein
MEASQLYILSRTLRTCERNGILKPVETLFKQIQDGVEFAEAGGVAIGAAHKLSSS